MQEQILPGGEDKERLAHLKTAVFIDGPYLSKAAGTLKLRDKNMDFDFQKMLLYLLGPGQLVFAKYYTGLSSSPSARPFLHKIQQFGYEVVEAIENPVTQKPAPIDHVLITDLCLSQDQWQVAHVVSGDGDFAYPIKRLVTEYDKKIYIVAARHNISTLFLNLAEIHPSNIKILLLDDHCSQFTMRRVLNR
jgi:uncharacterized LabA/DUF88 family protein